jgi:hypothetical protein
MKQAKKHKNQKLKENGITESPTVNSIFDIVNSFSVVNKSLPPQYPFRSNITELPLIPSYLTPSNLPPSLQLPPLYASSSSSSDKSIKTDVNNLFSSVIFPTTSSEKLNIIELDDEFDDDNDDYTENVNLVAGSKYLTKELA